MIGAIVLTLRHKEGVKRQSIAAQVARGKKTAIEIVKVQRRGRRRVHPRQRTVPDGARRPASMSPSASATT